MAFFEQVGKLVSNAGQSVAHSTKNFADVTQLNSAISDKQKKMTKLYLDLGQAYYEKHREDPDAEEGETIAALRALESEIARDQETIKQIKGVTKCENCGADVPLHAAFCSACGARISHAAEEQPPKKRQRICPACGALVAAGNLFCNQCGTRVEDGK